MLRALKSPLTIVALTRLTIKPISQGYYYTVLGLTGCVRFNKLRQNKSDTPPSLFETRQGAILGGGLTETD